MDNLLLEKTKHLQEDLRQALARFKEALELPATHIHRDATIQRFEFCFELSWKLMVSIAKYEGIDAFGPRDAIRTAAQTGCINDPGAWFAMLEARNLTTHTYNEAIAADVYEKAKLLPPLIDALLVQVKKP